MKRVTTCPLLSPAAIPVFSNPPADGIFARNGCKLPQISPKTCLSRLNDRRSAAAGAVRIERELPRAPNRENSPDGAVLIASCAVDGLSRVPFPRLDDEQSQFSFRLSAQNLRFGQNHGFKSIICAFTVCLSKLAIIVRNAARIPALSQVRWLADLYDYWNCMILFPNCAYCARVGVSTFH
eukprot:COSAG02_NODE_3232_length_7136_cov_264.805741_5_plen_181_part_00